MDANVNQPAAAPNTPPSPADLAGLIREFAVAVRGSVEDGRSLKLCLDAYAGWVEDPSTYPGLEAAREELDVCRLGQGHWTEYCPDHGHHAHVQDELDGVPLR